MKDEIKEIYLSNLEWTKTHDNTGGATGNLIFKDNMPYEEYGKLLKSGYFILCNKDYITNLQQENERLKEIKPCMLNFQECYVVKDYKSRLEKASEYINNHLYMESTAGIQHPTFDGKPSYDFDCFDLLNILQNGSENND